MKYFLLSFIVAFTLFSGINFSETPEQLECEMLENPEGIDVKNPRLGWKVKSDQQQVKQTAYRIIVASSEEKLKNNEGDLWDSGKIESDKNQFIEYAGDELNSKDEAFWKVKIWTNKGESSWSKPAYWSMGILNYNEWKSTRWIGMDEAFQWDDVSMHSRLSARHLRKEFEAQKAIKQAKVYIMGLGLYELYINGNKIGDQVLAPVPTDYNHNVKYNVFDVTNQLKQGDNAIGTLLGNGRYFTMRQRYKPYKIKNFGFPKMAMQLVIEYEDGETETLKTDPSWKLTAEGPIISNNEYDGEEYDARKEMPGWTEVGFNDESWIEAEYVQAPEGVFEAQMTEHMKVVETIKPVSIEEIKPETYILDMGQNMVGWVKMKVGGNRGDQVTLRFAEVLDDNGELAMDNLRDAKVTDKYTLKGEGEEVWEPSFVYHGFRYVEITGYPGKPTIEDFEGRVVNDALNKTGSFETSNSTINQVFENAYWGIRGNYKGMPIDCPQRNERQPWLGDRPTSAYGESFVFDNSKLYAKWLDDIQYAQKADGAIPDVAPAYWNYYSDNMTWPGTYLMVADMLYKQYGDIEVIKKHYPSMKKWLRYMKDRYMSEAYILEKDSYGDWVAPPATLEEGRGMTANVKHPSELISTAYHYHYLQMMQKFARLTENDADVKGYRELASKIKEGFNKEFFNPDEAGYGENTLTDNLLPLYFEMIPDRHKDAVFKNVVDIIEVRNDGHLSTGVVGTQWIMRSLTENGRPDLAYKLATNTTFPSWGYMVENGATTIWELWNGNVAAPSMNSYNHVMLLGDLIIWYYENLAGIKSAAPGFKEIEMKPSFVDGLDYVKASYNSQQGEIKSHWERKGKRIEWNIEIPANTTAQVYVPSSGKSNIEINNKKIGKSSFEFSNYNKIELGSGSYTLNFRF